MGVETMTLEELFAQSPILDTKMYLIGVIVGSLLAAFFSFRFLKISIVISAALTGYEFGAVTLGVVFGDGINGFNAAMVVGIACAIILALISLTVYKWYIYFIGGLLGALLLGLVAFFACSALALSSIVVTIAVIALAIVGAGAGAKIFYRSFKTLYILLTSLTGMVVASVCVSLLAFGTDEVMLGLSVLVGLVLTAFAAAAQFRMNRDRELDL